MTPYFEKYYATVWKIVENRDREFAEVFMNGLSPAFMARETDESAFKELYSRTTDETNFFSLFLKKQIETIDIVKKSRQEEITFNRPVGTKIWLLIMVLECEYSDQFTRLACSICYHGERWQVIVTVIT